MHMVEFRAAIHAFIRSGGGRVISAVETPVEWFRKELEVAEYSMSEPLSKVLDTIDRYFKNLS